METLKELQPYAYFFYTVFLVIMLYGYIVHLYRAKRNGTRDYEKYAQLALDDEVTSVPLEANENNNKNSKK